MQHTPTRSACSASGRAASWPCKQCTRDAGRPSWWSWPSCGRRAWSDHRNHSASGRNGAYPGRRGRPKSQREYNQQWLTTTIPVSRALTLPALYWVTLCCWCLWHSLDLQYVRRVLGMLTCAERCHELLSFWSDCASKINVNVVRAPKSDSKLVRSQRDRSCCPGRGFHGAEIVAAYLRSKRTAGCASMVACFSTPQFRHQVLLLQVSSHIPSSMPTFILHAARIR